ncbi:MAG: hypothetical protein H6742_21180 [Alphaproteobacteria bacterium]|nr:hypothetical protein [Alphaproteobacteria bacterium]
MQVLLLLVSTALAGPPAAGGTVGESSPPLDQRPLDQVGRVELDGLRGVACGADGCSVLVGDRLHDLDPKTLALGEERGVAPADARLVEGPGGPVLLHPCAAESGWCTVGVGPAATPAPLVVEEQALPRSPQEVGVLWNTRHARGWRVPFLERSPSPTGGLLFLLRSAPSRLMRTGGAIKATELETTAPLFPWLPSVALHPTGTEAFVLPWPGGTLTGVDVRRMAPRWTLPLGPAAHGLFVDESGRLLVAEEAGAQDGSTAHPDGARRAVPGLDIDPTGDLALALGRGDRPDAARTVVVDLSVPRLVWRESGRYLSLVSLGDHRWLLATEQALVLLAPSSSSPSPPPE